MFKKSIFHLAVATFLLSASGNVLAGSASIAVPVSASVSQNCSINTGAALAFTTYDPVAINATAALNATGQISVACTKGSVGLTIGMDNGAHVAAAQRQMLGGTNAGLLQYNIFQPPSNTPGTACTFPGATVWGANGVGLLALTSAPSNVIRTYNVCGTIPGGQNVAADTYTDTVNATINF